MLASNCIVLLVLAGACATDENGGLCEGPMCPTEGSESGTGDGESGDGDGDGETGFGELCEPAPHQSSSVCGDGIVGEEEPCDDANSVDDDGCSNTCESTRGQLVASFSLNGARAIAGVPGVTPEQTIIVLGTDQASLVAVDTSGTAAWSAPLGGPGFGVQDVQVTDAGEYMVAGANGDLELWLAHVDAQGQVVSNTPPDPNRGYPHADTLLRADGSWVVVGARELEDEGFIDHAGVFTYDAALDLLWEATPWNFLAQPIEPAEQSDGTIIVVAVLRDPLEGGHVGLQLVALDPNGGLLWTKSETCSVSIGARVLGLAALSDDTILISLDQTNGSELLRYDQDTLVSRERWPVYASHNQIFADDQGGAWLVSDGEGGMSHVAYWHPDPARRWVGSGTLTGSVLDSWLEPGRRIWYMNYTGEVFAVSI